MTMRSFVAPDGERWQVWRVVPGLSAPVPYSPGMEQGWLCFESEGAKRRLSPPPVDWDTCADARLVRHWYRATPALPFGAPLPAATEAGPPQRA